MNWTDTFSVAEPDPVAVAAAAPDPFATRSHEALEVAVHATAAPPACVRRTACAGVCDVNAAPLLAPVKFSDVRSIDINGPVPFWLIENVCPPIVSVTVRGPTFGFELTV